MAVTPDPDELLAPPITLVAGEPPPPPPHAARTNMLAAAAKAAVIFLYMMLPLPEAGPQPSRKSGHLNPLTQFGWFWFRLSLARSASGL